jgi:hypothetical protein
VGFLSLGPNGQWIVTHFKDRQSADPPSRRMHRYREALQKHGSRYDLVTKRNTDVDIDKEAEEEKEVDVDAEEENAGGCSSPLDELVKTFIDHTSIPVNTGGEDKWAKALARLREAGVEPADIVSALGECAHKGIVIANLGSIVNPAIISMARRKAGKAASEQDDAARYLKGRYAHLLRHE